MIKSWMEQRLLHDQPVVSGLLQEGQLFFPAPVDQPETVTVSPTTVYYEELASPEELKRKSKEINRTLESLAVELKTALKQESVFIIYQNEHWFL